MTFNHTLPWISTAACFVLSATVALAQEGLAAQAQKILKKHCFECHGGKKTNAKLNVLDRDLMLKRKILIPGNLKESELVARILAKDDSMMPPEDRPRPSTAELQVLQDWVKAGASFSDDVPKTVTPSVVPEVKPAEQAPADDVNLKRSLGAGYILQAILQDVRKMPIEERRNYRYFSLTHLLGGGTTREELVQHRDALAKAINHLSWKPKLVRPTPVESTFTVYRVDLRELGWDKPLQRRPTGPYPPGKPIPHEKSPYDLYDLVLLEYPYGVIHSGEPYTTLCREYLIPAAPARPIAYVRGDWFASTATQPPLYHDLMQLPLHVSELETQLGVNCEDNLRTGRAIRGGVIVSGVSRNNRVNERHPARYGYYWKSFDFKSSQAQENIFLDPINLNQSGGEMVFALPNGLQGYYICDDKGKRIDAAPTNIVVDTFSSDKVVRNGLACMRCHDKGTKPFADVVRPVLTKITGKAQFDTRLALLLYREQASLDRFLTGDQDRFLASMKVVLGKESIGEPLRPVTRRFIDERVTLAGAASELGLPEPKNLSDVFRRPQFLEVGLAPLAAGQPLARDAWEVYYDRVVRLMGLGNPVANVDAITRTEYAPAIEPPFTLEVKTNKRGNTFEPNDEWVVFVKPSRGVYVEIVGTSARGHKVILAPSSTYIKADEQYRYPPAGKKLKVPKGPAQETITVLASLNPFPAGEIHTAPYVADRVVHPYRLVQTGNQIQVQVSPDPLQTVKRTIAIEIR